jgi:hypothetical protein
MGRPKAPNVPFAYLRTYEHPARCTSPLAEHLLYLTLESLPLLEIAHEGSSTKAPTNSYADSLRSSASSALFHLLRGTASSSVVSTCFRTYARNFVPPRISVE